MILIDTVVFLASMAGIFTLRLLRDGFLLLEIITCYMVIVISVELVHSSILDNLKLLRIPNQSWNLVGFKMCQLIIIPIATLWLVYMLLHPKVNLLLKVLLAGVWFSVVSIVYPLLDHLGVIRLVGLDLKNSTVVWSVVLVVSFAFSLWFHTLVNKRGYRDFIPT